MGFLREAGGGGTPLAPGQLAARACERRAASHADALTEADLAAVIDHIHRSQAAATAGKSFQGTPL